MYMLMVKYCMPYHMQWAYGVTCWEIFNGGKVPYASVNLTDLPQMLVNGHRLEKPINSACTDEM